MYCRLLLKTQSACLRVAASAKAGIGHSVILDPKLKAESSKWFLEIHNS